MFLDEIANAIYNILGKRSGMDTRVKPEHDGIAEQFLGK